MPAPVELDARSARVDRSLRDHHATLTLAYTGTIDTAQRSEIRAAFKAHVARQRGEHVLRGATLIVTDGHLQASIAGTPTAIRPLAHRPTARRDRARHRRRVLAVVERPAQLRAVSGRARV